MNNQQWKQSFESEKEQNIYAAITREDKEKRAGPEIIKFYIPASEK